MSSGSGEVVEGPALKAQAFVIARWDRATTALVALLWSSSAFAQVAQTLPESEVISTSPLGATMDRDKVPA